MTYTGKAVLLYVKGGKWYTSHRFLGVDGFEPMASDSIHLATRDEELFEKTLSYRALSFDRGGGRDLDDSR